MPRLDVEDLRAEADAANSRKSLKRKSSIRKQGTGAVQVAHERWLRHWRCMLLAALGGSQCIDVPNLDSAAIELMRSRGIGVTSKYLRRRKKSVLVGLLAKKKANQERLRSWLEESGGLNAHGEAVAVRNWLLHNRAIAYACDLEHWFGPDLNQARFSGPEVLDELRLQVAEKRRDSRSDDRIRALGSLIRAIGSARRAVQAGMTIRDLDNEILAFLNDPDFVTDDEVRSIHVVSWEKGRSDEGELSLSWFASERGQLALKNFEEEAMRLARQGIRELKVQVTDVYGSVLVRSATGSFGQMFPSSADFCEATSALGYGINDESIAQGGQITVAW